MATIPLERDPRDIDRNQGNVAIARATRAQLHAEYTARLTTATGEISAMLAQRPLLEAQRDRLQRELSGAAQAAASATAAYDNGTLDQRTYVDLVSTELAKELEMVNIERSLLESQVALATLTGAGMPLVALPPEGAS